MAEYYEALVLFDYQPVSIDELRLFEGELVEVRVGGEGVGEEEGWLYGSDQRGRHGTFPANYVTDASTAAAVAQTLPGDSTDANGGRASVMSAALPGESWSSGHTSPTESQDDQATARATASLGPARGGLRNEEPVGAAYNPGSNADREAFTYQGKQERRPDNLYTPGTSMHQQHDHAVDEASRPAPTTHNSAIVEDGVVSDSHRVPDGWFSATDESSGVMYYYTEDGQSSWTRPPATTAAKVKPSSMVRGGDQLTSNGNGTTSTTNIIEPGHALRSAGTPISFALRFSSRIAHHHADRCTDAALRLRCRHADKTRQLDGGDDEQERKARDLAAARIQAVVSAKRDRKINNSVQMKAVAHNEHTENETGGIVGPKDGDWHTYGSDNADNASVGAESGGELAWSMIKSETEMSPPATLSAVSPETSAETRESQEAKLDRGVEKLILSLVDERIMASVLSEEMRRRDAILSDVRETLTVLTDRLIAKSAKRKSKRPPQPPEITVGGSEHELSPPPTLRRETSTPEVESRRLIKKLAMRPEVLLGTTVRSPPKSRPETTKNAVGQPLSQQEQQRQTTPQLNDPTHLRASPGRCKAASPRHSAADGRSMGQPPFRAGGCIGRGPSHHVERDAYGGGGGAEAFGVGKRSPPPPSRSQPLRALVDCEERLSYRDHLRDSSGDKAEPFCTPERRRRRGDQRARRGPSGNALHNAASPSTLPRTADRHCAALEKQQAKAAQAVVALPSRHRSYDTSGHEHHHPRHGGAPLYPPSWYDPKQADKSRPDSSLVLEYVHGYAGETPDVLSRGVGGKFGGGVGGGSVGGGRNSATRSTNVLWLRSGEIVYPAAGVVVIHDFETNRQRFFTGHDEASVALHPPPFRSSLGGKEVTAVAVHPHHDIVASGQAGREAIVCLFDATQRRSGAGGGGRRGSQENDSSDSRTAAEAAEPSEGATAVPAPVFLREISLGKRKARGVAALDFSPCGDLILAMAGGEGQSLSVWDWRRGERLAAARAESVHLPASSVRFNPWLFLQGTSAVAAGLDPAGAACYTLVSCGERHVRFWALTREWCPRRRGGGGGGGVGVGGETYEDGMGGNKRTDDGRAAEEGEHGDGGGWKWSLSSRPGNFGVRGELGTMTCMAFIGEPRAGKEERQRRKRQATGGAEDGRLPLPMARAITGSENGQSPFITDGMTERPPLPAVTLRRPQIYFWEISEARQGKRHNKHQTLPSHHHPTTVSPNRSDGGGEKTAHEPVGWQPGGRLLAVVPKVHDGAITDVSYLPHGEDGRPPPAAVVAEAEAARVRFGGGAGEGEGSSGGQEWGRLATCGGKGTLRLWSELEVGRAGVAGEGPSPLQLLLTISVSNRGVGVGYPRSVSWDRSGTTLALGTVGNAVALVQPGEGELKIVNNGRISA
ncbi:unnamed protein product [Ectocarpus sp. CCAP 1310/34]|nr:unnamed protein product [Ectocarpus sp. CCAP 1310/34]